MNKAILGGIVTVVAIAGIVGVIVANQKDDSASSTTANPSNMAAGESAMPMPPPSSADGNASAAAVETNSVAITDFKYAPATIKVKKGTTVTWTNQDSAKHDVMPDKETAAFRASDLFGKGESYSFTFNTAGTYTYHCSPHPYMQGTVEVVE